MAVKRRERTFQFFDRVGWSAGRLIAAANDLHYTFEFHRHLCDPLLQHKLRFWFDVLMSAFILAG